jgi:hypothetical protein
VDSLEVLLRQYLIYEECVEMVETENKHYIFRQIIEICYRCVKKVHWVCGKEFKC